MTPLPAAIQFDIWHYGRIEPPDSLPDYDENDPAVLLDQLHDASRQLYQTEQALTALMGNYDRLVWAAKGAIAAGDVAPLGLELVAQGVGS